MVYKNDLPTYNCAIVALMYGSNQRLHKIELISDTAKVAKNMRLERSWPRVGGG